jgi:tetratricopeptide (TPR) repeat protein
MIDNSGKVFITDFGLARSLATSGPRRPGQISGTPKYFSPEQARGEESDPRSDIYSLGVILYEMATGEAPFKSDSAEGYIKKHTSERPAAPSKLNPGLPSSCERIILRCLEKRREDRYQSADELLGELRAHWPPAPRPGIGVKRAGLQKLLVAAGATLVMAAIGWKVILPLLRQARPTGQPLIAVMYAVNNSGDKGLGDQLRWFVPHYLSEFLYQSRHLRVLRQDRLMSILSDLNKLDEERPLSRTLDRISEAANVGYFVLPSCAKVGDSLMISTSVIKAKTDVALGEPDTAKGNPEQDLLAMVEELSQKVKSKLDLSPEEIAGDAGRGQITTTSPAALRHYTDGERYYARGDYVSSLKAFELAVREDPNFAMAYLKLADSYEYVGDYAKHRSYLQKALALADRVSDKDRLFIQGYASYVLEESPLKAIESYKKLIEIYPLDEGIRIGLGAIYRNLEEWDLAAAQFDRILDLNPRDPLALENKIFIDTAVGRYDKALALNEDVLSSPPAGAFFVRQRPLIQILQGRIDSAAAELDRYPRAQRPYRPTPGRGDDRPRAL